MFVFIRQAQDITYDRTNNWPKFYEEVVSSYFKFPSAAVVRQATYTESAIMGMRFSVYFTLPKSMTPEKWLTVIASDSSFQPSYRKGAYFYDCGNDCDLLKLQYLPEQDIYIAEAGWD